MYDLAWCWTLMSCMDVQDEVVMQGIFSTSLLREAESGEYYHNLQREWGEGNAEKRIKTPHHYHSEKISHFLPLLQFLDINVRFRLLCIPNLICIESSFARTFILLPNGISSLSVQFWLITNRKKWIMWQDLQKYGNMTKNPVKIRFKTFINQRFSAYLQYIWSNLHRGWAHIWRYLVLPHQPPLGEVISP